MRKTQKNDASGLFTHTVHLRYAYGWNAVSIFSSERSNELLFGEPVRYEERFETILKSAAAIFAQRGYARASIRDVAKAAGISVAGLYYYCRSKEVAVRRLLPQLRCPLHTLQTPQRRI
jgi:hypothetical protein